MPSNRLRTSQAGSQKDGEALTSSEARARCREAKREEEIGNYDQAAAALGGLWGGVGVRPSLASFDEETAAGVLLRVGSLTGLIGKSEQIEGAQPAAKDLLGEAAELFEKLGAVTPNAEALTELGMSYWREGRSEEARIYLRDALDRLAGGGGTQRALTMLRLAIVESSAGRALEALDLLGEAEPLFEAIEDEAIKGKFHMNRAAVLASITRGPRAEEFRDRALVENAAATFHLERAEHHRYLAAVENNTAYLLYTAGRCPEAHEHLDRARSLFAGLGDVVHVAEVDETRARTMLSEGRLGEAESTALDAVLNLDEEGAAGRLVAALTTLGRVQARMGNASGAQKHLERAVKIARQADDLPLVVSAEIAIIEELFDQIGLDVLGSYYLEAERLAAGLGEEELQLRLGRCARRIITAHVEKAELERIVGGDLSEGGPWAGWHEDFSLGKMIVRIEEFYIERALRDAKGSVSKAAKILGMGHHENLRHRLKKAELTGLNSLRNPIKPRRRSIIKKRKAEKAGRIRKG